MERSIRRTMACELWSRRHGQQTEISAEQFDSRVTEHKLVHSRSRTIVRLVPRPTDAACMAQYALWSICHQTTRPSPNTQSPETSDLYIKRAMYALNSRRHCYSKSRAIKVNHIDLPFVSMSEARSSAFFLTLVTCVLVTFSFSEVDAHLLMDDSALCESSASSCQSYTLKLIKDVKNLLGSNQQQNNMIGISGKDLEDLKAACVSNKQQNCASCVSRKDFEDLKAACALSQQQNNISSISRKDLEDLKAACASNQQQCPTTEPSTSTQAVISSFICEYRNHVFHFSWADIAGTCLIRRQISLQLLLLDQLVRVIISFSPRQIPDCRIRKQAEIQRRVFYYFAIRKILREFYGK